MMSEDTLKFVFNQWDEWIKQEMVATGDLLPTFVGLSKYNDVGLYEPDHLKELIMPVRFTNDKEKADALRQVKESFLALGVEAYVFFHEGWFAQIDVKATGMNVDNIDPKVSQYPDRVEGVFIGLVTDNDRRSALYQTLRKDGKVVGLKPIDTPGGVNFSGSFFSLLSSPVVRGDKSIREAMFKKCQGEGMKIEDIYEEKTDETIH